MQFIALPRSTRVELLDQPDTHVAELSANLDDIRLLNRWFGGTALALRCLRSVAPPGPTLTVLDVATGSADIPMAILAWARKSGLDPRLTAIDVSAPILQEAQRLVGSLPIKLLQADARTLPFADDAFDVSICCLALHHFDPVSAVAVLREMRRVSSHAVVITDLRRSYLGYVGAWLATRTLARNRLTQNDGPLSVLRAYRPVEVRALAQAAGMSRITVQRRPFFRLSLVARLDAVDG